MWLCIHVLLIGFGSGQVHYGFSVIKEMTVECSWGEQLSFILTVAGQSLEPHPLRASLHAASRSLPLGPSALAAVSVSALHAATTPVSSLLSCSCTPISPRAPGRALYIESIMTHCPHVCIELAIQGQVRILATGTSTLSTPCQAEPLISWHSSPKTEPE